MTQHANDQADGMLGDTPFDMTGLRRVTVEEAARLLGLSDNAVRKRLERGTLRSEKIDGVRFVHLYDNMSQHAPRHVNDMPTSMSGDIALIQAHLDSVNEQLDYLKSVIEKRDEEIRRKDHLLAAALERIPAIEEAPAE